MILSLQEEISTFYMENSMGFRLRLIALYYEIDHKFYNADPHEGFAKMFSNRP